VGAAISVVIGNAVGWLAAHLFVHRHVGPLPGPLQTLLPLGSAVGSTILARALTGSPLVSVSLAVAAYGLCMKLSAGHLVDDARLLAYARRTRAD
jgi:hypothetical protein